MSEYPSLFFNEYFRRKPDRLSERENERLFMIEKSEECDFEYVAAEGVNKQLEAAKALILKYEDALEVIKKDAFSATDAEIEGIAQFALKSGAVIKKEAGL